jgi:aminoglycoside phosphotransferase (APT) family kinase protein
MSATRHPEAAADACPDPLLRDAVLSLAPSLAAAVWLPLSGGRTNRLWRVGDLVVKRHDPAAASPLFPNSAADEARALAAFAPLGLAPRLRAAGPDWVIYDHLDGAVWTADPAPVARMLGRLHALPPTATGFRAMPNGSAALLDQARQMAAGLDLPPPPPDPALPPVAPRLLHGDAVAGNVIVTPDGPRLIDWQCPGLGDPAEDIATFLSPAMMWLYSGRILTAAERAAFLSAYPDRAVTDRFLALEPVFRWRMAAHCAWRARRGDAGYARALRLEL